MAEEIANFVFVWLSAATSLYYCYRTRTVADKGFHRLIAYLPVILLFFYLPLKLHSMWLGGPTYFFLAWLATFRLLLFAFGHGPLSADPPLSFPLFVTLTFLPVHVTESKTRSPSQNTKIPSESALTHALKVAFLGTFMPVFEIKDRVHPVLLKLFYCVYLYISLENLLFLAQALVERCMKRVNLDRQFNRPYMATSLQDFWGRRWNLAASNVLKPSVYLPVKRIAESYIGHELAKLLAVFSTFLVSGLIHELIFYYICRRKPSLQATCFFVLNGVCLAAEMVVKKVVGERWRLPGVISAALTVAFVAATGAWLLMTPLVVCEADMKVHREAVEIINFLPHPILMLQKIVLLLH